MSVNMSDSQDVEQVTGTVAATNGDSVSVDDSVNEIVDLDEIVDRRNEVAMLVSARHDFHISHQSGPTDQRSQAVGTVKIGTAQEAYDISGGILITTPNDTDSMDPVGPLLHDAASAGESQIEGAQQAGVGAGSDVGGHDTFRYEFHAGDRLVADREFDARDSINAVFNMAVTDSSNRFIERLTYQYTFELHPA